MGIILMEGPDPKQPLQNPAEFMPVNQTDFSRPQRQILLRVRLAPVNEHTAGAVHRFDGIVILING